MSLKTQGFLSDEVDGFRAAVRRSTSYKPWFDFADDLIALGFEMLDGHEMDRGDTRGLLLSVLLVRCHQSLQAATILAERGMVADARIVVRSAVESAIACVAIAADPTFVDRLIEAHHKQRATAARELLADPDYAQRHSPDQTAKLNAAIMEAEAFAKPKAARELRSIVWADVAKKHCKDLYIALYRPYSGDGTHTTLDTMERYVTADANGNIEALKLGPDHVDLDEALDAACLTFLWAAGPFAQVFDKKASEQRIAAGLAHYRRLATA